MDGKVEALAQLKSECIACKKCAIGGCIYDKCPGNVFSSMTPDARVVVIGQNPGAVEVKTGVPFVGPSGANFDAAIKEALGVDRSFFYISNCVRCFTPNNRKPSDDEMRNCRPFMDREFDILKPRLCIALGGPSLFQMTGLNGIEKHIGKVITSLRYGVPVLALYHPSPMNWNNPTRRQAFMDALIANRERIVNG